MSPYGPPGLVPLVGMVFVLRLGRRASRLHATSLIGTPAHDPYPSTVRHLYPSTPRAHT